METLNSKIEPGVAMMDAEFFEGIKVAEKNHDISFVMKGNALKCKSDQTK